MIDPTSEIAFGFLLAFIGYLTTYLPAFRAKLITDGLALILLPFSFIGSIIAARDISDISTIVQLYAEYEISGMLGDLGGSLFNKVQSVVAEFVMGFLSIFGR